MSYYHVDGCDCPLCAYCQMDARLLTEGPRFAHRWAVELLRFVLAMTAAAVAFVLMVMVFA